MMASFLTSSVSVILSLMVSFSYAGNDGKSKSEKNEACEETLKNEKVKKKRKQKEKNENKEQKVKAEKTVFLTEDQKKENLILEIKDTLKDSTNPLSKILMDHLNTSYVLMKATREGFWTLSLLVGNRETVYTPEEAEDLEKAAKRINELGYFIIHDANSAAAPIISKACGKYSLAIGTSDTPEELRKSLNNFALIDDPYLRLFAFQRSEHATFSPDSIAGLAVLVNGKINSHIPFVRSEFKARMRDWQTPSEPHLGMPDYRTPDKITLRKVFLAEKSVEFSVDQVLKFYELNDLKGVLATSKAIARGRTEIEKEMKGAGGALVIGSARYPSGYITKTYDIVKYFASQGVPIVTGGSGGVMEIANAAAYDAGAVSIGVPITGEKSLKGEKNIFGSIHTLTVPAEGYASRLPLLTEERKMIVIAPGGGGTMKEIAVLLMKQAVAVDPEVVYVFIGSDYWKGVLKDLKEYLPERIVNNMFTVNSVEQARALFEQLPKTVWQNMDLSKVRLSDEIKPRNDFAFFKTIEQRSFEQRELERSKRKSFDEEPVKDEESLKDADLEVQSKLKKLFGVW